MKRRLGPATGLAAAVLSVLALAGCGSEPAPAGRPADAPVEVGTDIAQLEDLPRTIEATGSVEPFRRVSPGTKIMGRVESVLVREGDAVRQGQVLARLDSRDLAAAVEQARAALAMAEANLENSRAQYNRITELHGRGSATGKNLEDATAGFRVAQASVQQAKANVSAAEVMLGYAEIAAPIPGFVTQKSIEAGDMASPGMPLFTVEDLARVKVLVQVPEQDMAGLAEGGPATLELAGNSRRIAAKIDRIVPAGDPRSRTFEVRLVLDNPGGELRSGSFARALFPVGTRRTLTLPASAVVERGQLRGVFVIERDGAARLRWIRTGRAADGRVEVLSGMSAGERYVVTPPPGLADGAAVAAR
ncbi:MAG: efflux RND transporter periplasmic adaptor subunit [Acidobacteria bacterium]|nr:efflux RND transporter periplasmic adaptor subunit [Acidobacteriota bacterium]